MKRYVSRLRDETRSRIRDTKSSRGDDFLLALGAAGADGHRAGLDFAVPNDERVGDILQFAVAEAVTERVGAGVADDRLVDGNESRFIARTLPHHARGLAAGGGRG